jgi:Raf kinase inhibitor-like YbhB/YbcL family protein
MKTGSEFAKRLVLMTAVAAVTSVGALAQQGGGGRGGGPAAAPAPPMTLTSSAFKDSTPIPAKYGCSAQPSPVSPALSWTNVPQGTVSFALILHDMEPRPQRGITDNLHWMVWNIPPNATSLPEGVPAMAPLPDGTMQFIRTQGANPGTPIGYGAPCPPMNVPLPHHYVFDLFALDTTLALPANAPRANVETAINGHIIGHAVLVGLFNR